MGSQEATKKKVKMGQKCTNCMYERLAAMVIHTMMPFDQSALEIKTAALYSRVSMKFLKLFYLNDGHFFVNSPQNTT
jgi:hypothetical protein